MQPCHLAHPAFCLKLSRSEVMMLAPAVSRRLSSEAAVGDVAEWWRGGELAGGGSRWSHHHHLAGYNWSSHRNIITEMLV